MKRNWNVVRKILELVEEGKLKDYIEEKRYRDEFSINSPDDGAPNELLGHFEILVDAGILKHCEIQTIVIDAHERINNKIPPSNHPVGSWRSPWIMNKGRTYGR